MKHKIVLKHVEDKPHYFAYYKKLGFWFKYKGKDGKHLSKDSMEALENHIRREKMVVRDFDV
jgi:hypothetical protein